MSGTVPTWYAWLAFGIAGGLLITALRNRSKYLRLRSDVRASGRPPGAADGCLYAWLDGCRFSGPDAGHRYERLIGAAFSSFGAVTVGGLNRPTITVNCNISDQCFTIHEMNDDGTEDAIHICDWPAMRATIDAFQIARSRLSDEPSP